MLANAYSQDGFIIRQGRINDLKYGRYPSSKNGCGWIAAFNIQKLLGNEQPPEKIAGELSRTLIFGGKFGTMLVALLRYLSKKGIRYSVYFTKKQAIIHSRDVRCGILLCRYGRYGHYISFENNGGRFRFFNSTVGSRAGIETLEAYLKALKPWLCVSILIKEGA